MTRYVALGSSMAAGPGISPKAPGSPLAAMRSARNYPHLVARDLGLDLVDVTYSGATTAHVLTDSQHGEPPQVEALDGSEALVTVTIGGNDVGYVPMLCAAALPAPLRWLPRCAVCAIPPPGAGTCGRWPKSSCGWVARSGDAPPGQGDVRRLPDPAAPARNGVPLSPRDVDLGREIAAELERLTAAAAGTTGCGVVRAAEASRAHHAWSARPWTTLPSRFPVPIPGHTAPLHPNADGMRAVADLMVSECGVAEFRA